MGSEAKFGTLLFGHCPLDSFYFVLHPHEIIAVVTCKRRLNALDQGATSTDELVTDY